MNRTVMIRLATPEDAVEMLKIYAPLCGKYSDFI